MECFVKVLSHLRILVRLGDDSLINFDFVHEVVKLVRYMLEEMEFKFAILQV